MSKTTQQHEPSRRWSTSFIILTAPSVRLFTLFSCHSPLSLCVPLVLCSSTLPSCPVIDVLPSQSALSPLRFFTFVASPTALLCAISACMPLSPSPLSARCLCTFPLLAHRCSSIGEFPLRSSLPLLLTHALSPCTPPTISAC